MRHCFLQPENSLQKRSETRTILEISQSFSSLIMKRTFASIVTAFIVFSIASPALARSYNATRWPQPSMDRRALKRSTVASYQHRWNLAYRRERYRNVVARILSGMPSTLAVTGGGRNHADFQVVNRPTARSVDAYRLSNRCDVRFGGRARVNANRPTARNMCTQVDE